MVYTMWDATPDYDASAEIVDEGGDISENLSNQSFNDEDDNN